jgi:hypothetical protein
MTSGNQRVLISVYSRRDVSGLVACTFFLIIDELAKQILGFKGLMEKALVISQGKVAYLP